MSCTQSAEYSFASTSQSSSSSNSNNDKCSIKDTLIDAFVILYNSNDEPSLEDCFIIFNQEYNNISSFLESTCYSENRSPTDVINMHICRPIYSRISSLGVSKDKINALNKHLTVAKQHCSRVFTLLNKCNSKQELHYTFAGYVVEAYIEKDQTKQQLLINRVRALFPVYYKQCDAMGIETRNSDDYLGDIFTAYFDIFCSKNKGNSKIPKDELRYSLLEIIFDWCELANTLLRPDVTIDEYTTIIQGKFSEDIIIYGLNLIIKFVPSKKQYFPSFLMNSNTHKRNSSGR